MIVKGGGGGACKSKKKEEKRKKATKLRSFCDSKLLHLRKSRFRGGGEDVACGLLYKIFWNPFVRLYRAFVLIFFNIRVFHSELRQRLLLLERERERKGKKLVLYRNYSTDSKRNNGQTNGNWFEFANDTGSRSALRVQSPFRSVRKCVAKNVTCGKKQEANILTRPSQFRFIVK